MRGLSFSVCVLIASVAAATPPGFVKTTIPLAARRWGSRLTRAACSTRSKARTSATTKPRSA